MKTELTTQNENTSSASTPPLPTEAQQQWARCRHYIERAIARGPGFDAIEDIEREIAAGRLIFWAAKDGAVITRIDQFTHARVLVVTYAGGDATDSEMIARFVPELENFARMADCDRIAVEAQPQHAELFEDAGFAPLYSVFSKPIISAEDLAKWVEPTVIAPAPELITSAAPAN